MTRARARDARAGLPPGCFLGIETSGPPGSVAVAVDGVVAAVRFLGEQASHADRLIPAIRGALEDAGRGREDLQAVAVGAGPGSFTGVRVGAAAAKGLACGLNVPLCVTSSLRAAAFAQESMAGVSAVGWSPGPDPPSADEVAEPFPMSASCPTVSPVSAECRQVRYILADARGGRVYGACYDVGAEGPVEVIAPHGGTIADVINGRPPVGTVFAGSGAEAHKSLLQAAGYAVAPPPTGVPVAAAVLCCCRWAPVDVADWEPDYVREWRPG